MPPRHHGLRYRRVKAASAVHQFIAADRTGEVHEAAAMCRLSLHSSDGSIIGIPLTPCYSSINQLGVRFAKAAKGGGIEMRRSRASSGSRTLETIIQKENDMSRSRGPR